METPNLWDLGCPCWLTGNSLQRNRTSTSLGHVTSTNDDKLKVSGRAQGHSIPVTFSAYFLDHPKPGCRSSTPTGHPWAEAGPLLPEAPFWLSVYDP